MLLFLLFFIMEIPPGEEMLQPKSLVRDRSPPPRWGKKGYHLRSIESVLDSRTNPFLSLSRRDFFFLFFPLLSVFPMVDSQD